MRALVALQVDVEGNAVDLEESCAALEELMAGLGMRARVLKVARLNERGRSVTPISTPIPREPFAPVAEMGLAFSTPCGMPNLGPSYWRGNGEGGKVK